MKDIPRTEVYTLTAGDGEVEISFEELEETEFLWTLGTPLPEPDDKTVCSIGDRASESLRNATPNTSHEKRDWNWEMRVYKDELLLHAASLLLDGRKDEGIAAKEASDDFLLIFANGGPSGDLAELNADAQKILNNFGPIYADAGCGTFRVPTFTEIETGTQWDLD